VAERLSLLTDPELEAALSDVGRFIDFPPEPNVAPAVYRRIREGAVPVRSPWILGRLLPARPLRRAVALAMALVILAAGAAVAGLLGVPGLKLIFRPHASPGVSRTLPPVGEHLFLGTRTTLDQARGEVSFPVVVPHAEGLPRAVVYVSRVPSGGRVTLAYPPAPGLPAADRTGVGLLLTEFRGSINPEFFQKTITPGTTVRSVTVSGQSGDWIAGAPHEVVLVDRHGDPFPETVHLAGNTLMWQRGELTVRIEGKFGLQEALRIARSVQ
jgi:hypothetical protein